MDKALALGLCSASARAYSDELAPNEMRLDYDDTQAQITEHTDRLIVAFRGTQFTENMSWADIETNLKVLKVGWIAGGYVHRGYSEAIWDIWARLLPIVRGAHEAGKEVYYTGHSLGGVLATLASTLKPYPTATYTFGAPRCGNPTFVKTVRAPLYRIVNYNDIAPKYPLPYLHNMRHPGELWKLDGDGNLDRREWSFWGDQLIIPLTRKGLAYGTLMHSINNYLERMVKCHLKS